MARLISLADSSAVFIANDQDITPPIGLFFSTDDKATGFGKSDFTVVALSPPGSCRDMTSAFEVALGQLEPFWLPCIILHL